MALSNALPNSILKPGVCTSSTRPSNPYEGQFIYETNTDALLVYNGTAWVVPSGPTGNPTSNNQFANKSYVDTSVSNLRTSVDGSIETLETAISNRPTINGAINAKILCLSAVVETNENGDGTVSFPSGSFTSCTSVVACSGDMNAGPIPLATISLTGFSHTSFTFRVYRVTSVSYLGAIALTPHPNALVRVNYIAVGS
jgi:hypothetical protein